MTDQGIMPLRLKTKPTYTLPATFDNILTMTNQVATFQQWKRSENARGIPDQPPAVRHAVSGISTLLLPMAEHP